MTLKLRLNILITILLLLITLMGAVFTVKNARKNVQAEVSSTATLALHMLDAEILGLKTINPEELLQRDSLFHLHGLKNLRHLKIDFYNSAGYLQDSNRVESNIKKDKPPSWFINSMGSVTTELSITKRPVFSGNKLIGNLVITPDISYEVIEKWNETKAILILLGIFFFVVNIVVYFSVSIALRPIDKIISALSDLEYGHFSSRLPQFTLPELSKISEKFNIMATTLQTSIQNNHHLTQQLISLQEDERKNIAQELHDEIGQHLTAIHMDASAIKKAKKLDVVQASACAIDDIVRRMMEIVHTMLQRLRPADLDELGLKLALKELLSSWLERNPHIHADLTITGDFLQLSDTLPIAIYRIVQECLTNIARHANATEISLSIRHQHNQIHIQIRDNGEGFEPSKKMMGFGLAGMQERVEGLTGKFKLQTSINQGVSIMIKLPTTSRRL